jgi:hypothetical protein
MYNGDVKSYGRLPITFLWLYATAVASGPATAGVFASGSGRYLPDFSVKLLCTNFTLPPDDYWEQALTNFGFRPLSVSVLARRHGITYPVGQQRSGIETQERRRTNRMPGGSDCHERQLAGRASHL